MEPKALLQNLTEAGATKFVLSDINNTSACLDTVRMTQDMEIEPVLGIDFRNSAWQCYVGIAKNNTGFHQLNTHLSEHLHAKKHFEERAPELEDTLIIYPFSAVKNCSWITELRNNEFIGVTPRDLNVVRFSKIATLLKEKLVILQTITFRGKRDFNGHRLLRAIANNCLLSKLPVSEQGNPEDKVLSMEELKEIYADFPHIIKQSEELLKQCSIHYDFGTEHPHKNLKVYSTSEEDDYELIRKLAMDGLAYRYPEPTQEVLDRIEKELHIIKEKNFISYFLSTGILPATPVLKVTFM